MAAKKYRASYDITELKESKYIDVIHDKKANLYYICLVDSNNEGMKIAMTRETVAKIFADIIKGNTLRMG